MTSVAEYPNGIDRRFRSDRLPSEPLWMHNKCFLEIESYSKAFEFITEASKKHITELFLTAFICPKKVIFWSWKHFRARGHFLNTVAVSHSV